MTKIMFTRSECQDLAGTLIRFAADLNSIADRIKQEKIEGVAINKAKLLSLINSDLEDRMFRVKKEVETAFHEMKTGTDVAKKKDRERKRRE